jgi:uncharacterized membrane protein
MVARPVKPLEQERFKTKEVMVTSNKDLMTQAREALSGRWGLAVGTFFVYALIVVALNNPLFSWSGISSGALYKITISGNLIFLLIGGALTLGASTFALAIARKEEAKLEMIFSGKHSGCFYL